MLTLVVGVGEREHHRAVAPVPGDVDEEDQHHHQQQHHQQHVLGRRRAGSAAAHRVDRELGYGRREVRHLLNGAEVKGRGGEGRGGQLEERCNHIAERRTSAGRIRKRAKEQQEQHKLTAQIATKTQALTVVARVVIKGQHVRVAAAVCSSEEEGTWTDSRAMMRLDILLETTRLPARLQLFKVVDAHLD